MTPASTSRAPLPSPGGAGVVGAGVASGDGVTAGEARTSASPSSAGTAGAAPSPWPGGAGGPHGDAGFVAPLLASGVQHGRDIAMCHHRSILGTAILTLVAATAAPGCGGDDSGPVCPAAANCGVRVCGPDPTCMTFCGTCSGSETCSAAGTCTSTPPTCPTARNCAGRECGADPICSTSCGDCPAARPNCNAATGACSAGPYVGSPNAVYQRWANREVRSGCCW